MTSRHLSQDIGWKSNELDKEGCIPESTPEYDGVNLANRYKMMVEVVGN